MQDKFNVVILQDIPVLYVEVVGVANSSKAFTDLENRIGSLKGRKFYGTLLGDPENGVYRACVEVSEKDNNKELGLSEGLIPEGKYLQAKIADWNTNIGAIGETFKMMSEGTNVDVNRPYIEFYKSFKEVILLLPI